MSTTKIPLSIEAARNTIRTRRKPCTLKQINDALKAAKVKPVTEAQMDKYFTIREKDGKKFYSNKPAAAKKPEPKKECAKKPCDKKSCKKAKVVDNTDENDETTAGLEITVTGDFDVKFHNRKTSLYNCLVQLREAGLADKSEEYMFLVGADSGDWPREYFGIPVHQVAGSFGAMLVPKTAVKGY